MIMLSFAVLLSLSVSAVYEITQGSDWKWSYAQTYAEDDLAKLKINAEDIEFARMRVAAAEEDCAEIGGEDKSSQWCKWAEEDKQTLARMLKAQASQSITSQEDKSQTAWAKFLNIIKKLFGLS